MRSPANSLGFCSLDESLGELTEMNEPTDSELQETMPTGNEVEGGYLPLSDSTGDEDEVDMSTEAQDLGGKTEHEVNANATSNADHNPR